MKKGRHVFWRNNEIAGEAAIMQAFNVMVNFLMKQTSLYW